MATSGLGKPIVLSKNAHAAVIASHKTKKKIILKEPRIRVNSARMHRVVR